MNSRQILKQAETLRLACNFSRPRAKLCWKCGTDSNKTLKTHTQVTVHLKVTSSVHLDVEPRQVLLTLFLRRKALKCHYHSGWPYSRHTDCCVHAVFVNYTYLNLCELHTYLNMYMAGPTADTLIAVVMQSLWTTHIFKYVHGWPYSRHTVCSGHAVFVNYTYLNMYLAGSTADTLIAVVMQSLWTTHI